MAQPKIDLLFSTRSLYNAVEQWKTPNRFLINTFFKENKVHRTKVIEIDFFNQRRRVAPYVKRRSVGVVREGEGFRKFFYEPPYVKPMEEITPSDLQEVLIGENPYSDESPDFRLVKLRNEKLRLLEDSIQRNEEIAAMHALFNRSIPILDENGDELQDSIDFLASSGQDVTINWSTASTSKPLTDCRNAQKRVIQRTGLVSNIVVHGSTNADNFLASAEVHAYADRNQYAISQIVSERRAAMEELGVVFMGIFDGMEHYRYDEWREDPSAGNTEVSLIPANKTLVGAAAARSVLHYGAIETIEGTVQAKRWPKFYDAKNKDPEVYGLQIHSAPLPVTHQPDAYSVLTQS